MSRRNREAAKRALRDDDRLGTGAAFLLLALGDLVDDRMTLNAGCDFLAAEYGRPRSSVRRWRDELVAAGYLTPERFVAGGRQSNVYAVSFDPVTVRTRAVKDTPVTVQKPPANGPHTANNGPHTAANLRTIEREPEEESAKEPRAQTEGDSVGNATRVAEEEEERIGYLSNREEEVSHIVRLVGGGSLCGAATAFAAAKGSRLTRAPTGKVCTDCEEAAT